MQAASQFCYNAGDEHASRHDCSETKLSNGGLAGDDLGCNDPNRSKHGEAAVVEFKIAHVRVVAQGCTGLKRVAEIPNLFVWILLPKHQLESTRYHKQCCEADGAIAAGCHGTNAVWDLFESWEVH